MDLSPLRIRDFRLLYTARRGLQLRLVHHLLTIPYQVAMITDDPLMVGLLGVCELVPLLFMAFVGGALADYVDRRKLVLGGELAPAGADRLAAAQRAPRPAAALAAVRRRRRSPPRSTGCSGPRWTRLIPRLVARRADPGRRRAELAAAADRPARRPGRSPGCCIGRPGLAWVYGIDLATFVVSLVCLAMVQAVPPPEAADRPSLRSVVDGLRYARSRPELLGTYLVDINAMFFGMPQALYPFFAHSSAAPAVLGPALRRAAVGSMLATLTSGWTGASPPARPGGHPRRRRLGRGHHRLRPGRLAVAGAARAWSSRAPPT